MLYSLGPHLAAVATLLPAAALSLWQEPRSDRPGWAVPALALLAALGPSLWVAVQFADGWHTGFSATLWVAIAASAWVYLVTALARPAVWALAPLLMGYLVVLGLLAAATGREPGAVLTVQGTAKTAWLVFHIVVSVTTYALLTVAAVAALAAFLQERALKRKRPTRLTRRLPPIADSERLSVRLLALSEIVLGCGVASGMAVEFWATGSLLVLDHKTLLSLLAFAVIGALLLAHHFAGVRGRAAARALLLSYLLLTLAYPGVKFVSSFLIGSGA